MCWVWKRWGCKESTRACEKIGWMSFQSVENVYGGVVPPNFFEFFLVF